MKLSDLHPVPDDREGDIIVHTALIRPAEVSPFSAYLALRAQFGPPNSDKFDDMKTQWCYYLKWQDAHFEIYDWKLEALSIAVYLEDNDEERATKLGDEIANLIHKSSLRQTAVIAKAAKSATGYVFQNPYLLYYETGEELLARASQGNLGDATFCSRAAFFMFMSAFEGLLNLIYEMYLRREFARRADSRTTRTRTDRREGSIGTAILRLLLQGPDRPRIAAIQAFSFVDQHSKRLHPCQPDKTNEAADCNREWVALHCRTGTARRKRPSKERWRPRARGHRGCQDCD